VISDFTGIAELQPHGVAGSPAEAGALALRAGVDIDMVSGIYLAELPRLVRADSIREELVDEAVRRVLRAKYDLGLFDDPYRYSDSARERDSTLTAEHVRFARQLARESIVLLENRGGVLPLSPDLGGVAVIGPLADDRRSALGSWAAAGRPEDAVTVLEGVRAAVGPGAEVVYARGCDVAGDDTSGFAEAVRVARAADAAILVLGESYDMSGEAASRVSLELPGVQRKLAEAVAAAGKPVIVVLMNGRPLAVEWLAENVPAIVEAWYLGVQMGPAVADVLFGAYSPGGKLPVTFPRATGQVPIYYDHKNTGRPPNPEEKYTSKYIDSPWTPLFPFGHGLSYTEFEYGPVRLSAKTMSMSDTLRVEVEVRNVGARAGDEVVQLYIRDPVASITRPVKELRDFERIHLEAGESRTVSFELRSDDLAFYGRSMQRVIEAGRFQVFIGGSSVDVQEAEFELSEE
jgi:beta-glucosidase